LTYDLRRLRLAGPIARIEHTNRYVLTPDGINMAVFYSKVHTGCSARSKPKEASDQGSLATKDR
jgi:hypothetical protein